MVDYFGPTDFLQMDAHSLRNDRPHDAPGSSESMLVGGPIQENPDSLVSVAKEQRFQRYRANAETLRQLLSFLYAECCSRSSAVKPEGILVCSQ